MIIEKLKSMFDWLTIGVLYIVLRARWIYLHVHPRYKKFHVTGEESHFIHEKHGSLHSDIIINLNSGKSVRWWVYETKKAKNEKN